MQIKSTFVVKQATLGKEQVAPTTNTSVQEDAAISDTLEASTSSRSGLDKTLGLASAALHAPLAISSAILTPTTDGSADDRAVAGLNRSAGVLTGLGAATLTRVLTGESLVGCLAAGALVGGGVYLASSFASMVQEKVDPFTTAISPTSNPVQLAELKKEVYQKYQGSTGAAITAGLKHNFRVGFERGANLVDNTSARACALANGIGQTARQTSADLKQEARNIRSELFS